MTFHAAPVSEIAATTLYRILWLRVEVFVVEQQAAYGELDGRDIEPGAHLLWAEENGAVLATLRVLDEKNAWRIGRVATAEAARGRGIAAELMQRAIALCEEADAARPLVLDAQEHLAGWYARFGFAISGDAFVEDDIPHVPMRRLASGFPRSLGKVAPRELAHHGFTRFDQLTTATEAELLAIHGVGPKAVRILGEELAARGLAFRSAS